MPVDDSLLPRSAAASAWRCRRSAGIVATAELLAFAQLLRLPRVTPLAAARRRRRPARDEPVRRAAAASRWPRSHADGSPADRAPGATRAASAASRPSRSRPTAPRCRRGPPCRNVCPASAFEALARMPVSLLRRAHACVCRERRRARRRGREARLRQLAARRSRTRSIASASAGATAAAERRTRLRAIGAQSLRAAMGLDEAAFLPFGAAFEGSVPRYVAWLHDRERRGGAGRAARSRLRRGRREARRHRAARPHRSHRSSRRQGRPASS